MNVSKVSDKYPDVLQRVKVSSGLSQLSYSNLLLKDLDEEGFSISESLAVKIYAYISLLTKGLIDAPHTFYLRLKGDVIDKFSLERR